VPWRWIRPWTDTCPRRRRSARRLSSPGVAPCFRAGRRAGRAGAPGDGFVRTPPLPTFAAGGLVSGTDVATGAGADVSPASGRTSRIAVRHRRMSSSVRTPNRPEVSVFSIDEYDMQAARPMRAHLKLLTDIGAARGAGYEVHRARQVAAAPRTHPIPGVFHRADDLAAADHHYMGLRQEVQSRRALRARQQHQRTGFRDTGEGSGDRDRVLASSATARDREHRALVPWNRVQARVR